MVGREKEKWKERGEEEMRDLYVHRQRADFFPFHHSGSSRWCVSSHPRENGKIKSFNGLMRCETRARASFLLCFSLVEKKKIGKNEKKKRGLRECEENTLSARRDMVAEAGEVAKGKKN